MIKEIWTLIDRVFFCESHTRLVKICGTVYLREAPLSTRVEERKGETEKPRRIKTLNCTFWD